MLYVYISRNCLLLSSSIVFSFVGAGCCISVSVVFVCVTCLFGNILGDQHADEENVLDGPLFVLRGWMG